MRIKRRRKSSRFRGSQTARRGAKERTRGSGNQGGKGWSGTGKHAMQKKTLVIKLTGGNNYLGKSKTLRMGARPKDLKVINLRDIQNNLDLLISQGKAKESKGIYEIKGFEDYKILGEGEFSIKVNISAKTASESAVEKIKSAGGIINLDNKKESKEDLKSEAKENTENSKKSEVPSKKTVSKK